MYKNQKCLHTDRPTNQQTHIWKLIATMDLKINFDTLCSLSLGWTVHMNSHAKSCSFCSSKMAELWVLCTVLWFVQSVHLNIYAKSEVCSSKNEWVMVLMYCVLCHLVGHVHMNFHAKSGVCSSKTGWLMSILYFFLYFCKLFGLSIRTSMLNLESVAQKMSELCMF